MFDSDDLRAKLEAMPLYQKARQLFRLVEGIGSLIDEDDPIQKETRREMRGYAMILSAKIAGAESGGLYCIKMQNAALIRKNAMDLLVSRHSLDMCGFPHCDYLDLLAKEIEEFRLLFVDWVRSFDTTDYVVDDWGLFNPPGVDPDDEGLHQDQDEP